MAAEIFRAGLDRNVGATLVRREEQGRRPGIVHQHHRAAGMGHLGDGRDVLHLEALRAGRLGEHGCGVRPHQRADVAADQRVVIGGLDAEALEYGVAVLACRAVDGIGHQQVVAGLQAGLQRDHDGGKARRDQHGAGSARNVGPGLFEGLGGRRSLGAVDEALAPRLELFIGRIEHRRAAIDGRVDEAELRRRVAPAKDEARAFGEPFGVGRACHGRLATRKIERAWPASGRMGGHFFDQGSRRQAPAKALTPVLRWPEMQECEVSRTAAGQPGRLPAGSRAVQRGKTRRPLARTCRQSIKQRRKRLPP